MFANKIFYLPMNYTNSAEAPIQYLGELCSLGDTDIYACLLQLSQHTFDRTSIVL